MNVFSKKQVALNEQVSREVGNCDFDEFSGVVEMIETNHITVAKVFPLSSSF